MKKAALTFALISTVMVATSFATPETNSLSMKGIDNPLETDGTGAAGLPQKKVDSNRFTIDTNNDSNLGRVNQFLGGNKKVD